MVGIQAIDKPPRRACPHLLPDSVEHWGKRCAIYQSPHKPTVCGQFLCAWMQGHGGDRDRPNAAGVLVSVNELEDGRFVLVLELESGAVVGKGSGMISAAATNTRLPAIIVDYESLPPDDRGDRVAVHTSILYRSRAMLGEFLGWLGPEVAIHKLRFCAPPVNDVS